MIAVAGIVKTLLVLSEVWFRWSSSIETAHMGCEGPDLGQLLGFLAL
jgi:hypothetical protein